MDPESEKRPLHRVELHIHLDGSVRHETVLELSKQKGLPLPGKGTLEDLVDAVRVHRPKDLKHFLRGYQWILPPFLDDLSAIRRSCLEFCEDSANQGVIYTEVRFAPHLYLSGKCRELTTDDVVKTVCSGLAEGEERYGVQTRVLLCCFRTRPDWALEVAALCERHCDLGVVGIDIAGDERAAVAALRTEETGRAFEPEEVTAYESARCAGVHQTVHAGEDGPAVCVQQVSECEEVQ